MPHELSTDEECDLIARSTSDQAAFRRLYRHYFPRVYGYVAYRVGSVQDAEDLTADIFLRVVEALPTFDYRGAGSFAAWLFKIATNRVHDFYRRNQQRRVIALDDLPDIRNGELLPDEALMRKEQFSRLRDALAALSPRRQEVLTLRFFGGLRNQEIAAVLGLTERTVASHISRGLEDLQARFEQKEPLQ